MLIVSTIFSMTGCSIFGVQSENLMEGIKAGEIQTKQVAADAKVTDFGVRLFQNSFDGEENTLISPLSVLCALAMTANGAKGHTLTEMEEVLGLSVEELNSYLHSYMSKLPEGNGYKLSLANSIWFRDDERLTVKQDFLQTNADYYGADIYKTPFDTSTVKDINKWVKSKTDGMIEEIIEQIPRETVMYLVNALAFEAEWQEIYKGTQCGYGQFTREDGVEQRVKFMHSDEYQYLEDENAIGFIKYYKDRAYAFVALLPNEGISVADYVAALTGEQLYELLLNPIEVQVDTAIPKFESEYSVQMRDVLMKMGMTEAFNDELADFTGLGTSSDGNIFISEVSHKTFISVGEKGTKAGAVTVVSTDTGAAMPPEDSKEVILNRPFVYMLIDCENNQPFFIGTQMSVR